jgi:hypothetical protein
MENRNELDFYGFKLGQEIEFNFNTEDYIVELYDRYNHTTESRESIKGRITSFYIDEVAHNDSIVVMLNMDYSYCLHITLLEDSEYEDNIKTKGGTISWSQHKSFSINELKKWLT